MKNPKNKKRVKGPVTGLDQVPAEIKSKSGVKTSEKPESQGIDILSPYDQFPGPANKDPLKDQNVY